MANRPAWWETAFSGHYRTVYAHRDDQAATVEALALAPHLRHLSGPVLDVGCGHGRHLVALRRQGVNVFGLDYSPFLLADAQGQALGRGRLLRGDMRCPPVTSGWGAVLMLFTTFGYFTEAANRACLAAWASLLAPDGRLVVDLPEPDHLVATLQACSRRQDADGLEISETRSYGQGRMMKNVELRRGDQAILNYSENVRLYSREEFLALATEAGLAVKDCWSSLRGAPHDDHRLVWWLGKK